MFLAGKWYTENMPGKNVLKEYKPNTYYHLYNRGVDKQKIFRDVKDYKKFLGYLKLYLTPVELQGCSLQAPSRLKNYFGKVRLHAYCLMPNHYHFLLYQVDIDGINHFMRSLATKYSLYFNKKYQRVGPLYENIFKAVEIKTETQLIYISKYIHRNPADILAARMFLEGYKYSSYANYLGRFSQSWLEINEVLSYFKKQSYQDFVEEQEERDVVTVKDLTIDLEN